MIANCHLGFNCVDVEKTIEFYKNILGCKEKFRIPYAQLVDAMEKNGNFTPDYERYKGYAEQNIDWITYMEWPENPGYFIELFYGEDQKQKSKPNFTDIGYTHFAVIVDNLEELRERIISRGGEAYLDTGIDLGIDGTYQMWMHDPDGNKFEFMQYTENSLQLK